MAKSTVQFGKTAFTEHVSELQAIVDQVKDVRGTASARKAAALSDALTQDLPEGFKGLGFIGRPTDGKAKTLGQFAEFVALVNETADQIRDEMVTGILKANSPDTGTLDALKAQYAEKRALVDAMVTLMGAQGIDVSDVTIPALSKSAGSASTTTRTVSTSGMHYYREIDGVRHDQSDTQDKLSSMAWYYGVKITGDSSNTTNKGVGVPASVLSEFLLANGIESLTKPWTYEVDGVTYGMEILDK